MHLKVVFAPSDGGGFAVYVPSLPGCVGEGATKEKALKKLQVAIQLYLALAEDSAVARKH